MLIKITVYGEVGGGKSTLLWILEKFLSGKDNSITFAHEITDNFIKMAMSKYGGPTESELLVMIPNSSRKLFQ